MQIFLKLFSALGVALLASCGGGGGSAGGSGTTPAATVASFDYQLDKSVLVNSGSDEATLVVTALDQSNNPVADASLAVVVDKGIYTPISAKTDSSGKASGKITIGSNKANRTIGFKMTIGGKEASGIIPVTGSQLEIVTVPAAPLPGTSVAVSVKVKDVNGSTISGTSVAFSGSLGLTGSVVTDANGNASRSVAAVPTTPGNYSVEVASSGISARRDVQVVSSTTGVPAANGVISAASLAITPNTIAPNTSGSTSNRAGLRAVFQDAANKAISNVRVRFEIVEPSLGSGEAISTGSQVVYSDESGVATAEYIAGTRSSPTNGVVIRACYGYTDADLANGACVNSRSATMTVASAPLAITLGENNELIKGENNLTYIKKLDVAVADSAGIAVSGAQISASIDLVRYGKGNWIATPVTVGETTTIEYSQRRLWCANEDTNRNGLLDVGEDIDGNGALMPRKADVLVSYVGGRTTGSNGRVQLQVEYPQNVATWVEYVVKVTTSVAGSEGTFEKRFVTDAAKADAENGSFLISPYGVNQSCSVRD